MQSAPSYDLEIEAIVTEIPSITPDMTMHQVFSHFLANRDYPFLPVVGAEGAPVGVVREYNLKDYAYAMYGRELIKRMPLAKFLTASLVVPLSVTHEELLLRSATNPNPDGILVTDDTGRYRGAILNTELLRLYEHHRLEVQQRLFQSQKIEAIGTLAGGIAHDFNNILTPILGYAELVKLDLQETEHQAACEHAEQVIKAANRARELVSQILTFSRQRNGEDVTMAVCPVVKEVAKFLRSSIPSTIELRVKIDINPQDDVVVADPIEVHQIIMNLSTNAYHAMREKGGVLTLSVQVYPGGSPSGWCPIERNLSGRYLWLSVRDTGAGIDPAVLPRVLEPFFTTKKVGEGTGMGLTVVHGIVSRLKGLISVETEVGKGSAFHVFLPVSSPVAIAPATTETVAHTSSYPPLQVLFVDDEPMIVDLAANMLGQMGFCVVATTSSREALELFGTDGAGFDAVITDQTMPELTGTDLARQILDRRPDIPVVLCSGHLDLVYASTVKAVGIREFVPKPIDFRRVADVVCGLVVAQPGREPAMVSEAGFTCHPGSVRG